MALIKCQHTWLKWFDSNTDFVRIFSFDFDSVSHNILCSKLKQVNINPYIINWLISFLDQRMQRVVVDGYINRSVPQGKVLGPVLFSIFINDIKAVNTDKNLLVKFADDITVSLPIEASVGLDESETEVQSCIEWSEKNCMQVNLTKTWELLLRGKTTRTPPEPLEIIGRKEKLKLLGVTFEQVPINWDTHIDYLLSKASSSLYILRICKYYGYTMAVGGTVASWLARSTPERALRVRALAGDIVLCSWARHFTLTVPLSTQVYKWVPAYLMLAGNPAMD